MRDVIFRLCLIALLSGSAVATRAQLVVWSQDFDSEPLGPYGTTENFGTSPTNTIVAPGMGGTGQAMEITFDAIAGNNINFQVQTLQYPATDNTNLLLLNYTLEFDMQILGDTPGFIMEISVQGPDGGTFSGHVSRWTVGTPTLPDAGVGYVHISLPLSNSVAGNSGTPLDPTASTFRIGFGALAFPTTITDTPETIDVDNIQILMNTNPPPIPPPTMHIVAAKPGLRVFAQNYAATYNQEGFGTVDTFQSWVGATPALPKSYSITFSDFDTVNNYTLYSQFVPNVASINPFVVYVGANALVWSITHQDTGFTTAVNWKTNSPNSGTPNNAFSLTTTSTNGRGTWTLTFTNDTDGTVTAPDGSSGSFSLPPEMAAMFADPVTILFGTAPNNPQGYGQWIDISRITITNVSGINEDDDFTKDDSFNIGLWNPAFSLDPGSVIQVSTTTPFWVNWTVPDPLFGLGTKADLGDTTIPWYTPDYYSGGLVTLTPLQMGPSLKWVLIPNACLPTLDGFPGGAPSPAGFFRLSSPAPNP